MKLRIKGNSVRLRLGQSEVHRVVTEGALEEITEFGPEPAQRFRYVLRASEKPGVSASFADQRMIVRVSQDTLRQWSATDQVSIQAIQRIGDSELMILIEKDFECTEPRSAQSQEVAFSRPRFEALACTDRLND